MSYRIGMDLGGTKIEGIALDPQGQEVYRKRIPTESDAGYMHILNRVTFLYQDVVSQISNQEHTFGIGVPGAVSLQTGYIKNANTLCLNQKPLKQDLEKKIKRNLEMQNDANCFALAEALQGAGRGKTLVFGVIMGTGCGGGIVYKNEVITGPQAIAGEWGHMTIDPSGPECYCGKKGCVETYLSGGGLEKAYARRFKNEKRLLEIVDDYRQEKDQALEFMGAFFQNYGRAVANLVNILDPDVIVLGGGVSNIDELYTEGLKEVRKNIFSDSLETPIVRNELGDSAGVIGAALIGI